MENRSGLLNKVPLIENKNGWPWDEEVDPIIYNNKEKWPKITIVTPSYNQGVFIEETIRSVLLQNYPNLEYIIVDGGSNDESVGIIKKYQSYIHYWKSEKDHGQSDAINKGFSESSGDVLAWINSDDVYYPKAFFYAAEALREKKGLLFGNAYYFNEEKKSFHFINVSKKRSNYHLPFDLGLIQPSTFWTRSLWIKTGTLDINLNYGFDWNWFLKASKTIEFTPCDHVLSIYRIHKNHKTGSGGERRANELLEILQKNDYLVYVDAIKKLGKYKLLIKSIVNLTSNYYLGIILFGGLRLINKDFRKFTTRELSELFKKTLGIYNY